jgi:hypothetical protein
MAEGKMVTKLSSKACPVARTLKVNFNVSSTDKESLITASFWSNME